MKVTLAALLFGLSAVPILCVITSVWVPGVSAGIALVQAALLVGTPATQVTVVRVTPVVVASTYALYTAD